MKTLELSIGFEHIDGNTPQNPDAKRGDSSRTVLRETKNQLDQNLIWWPCGFCGGYVLIASNRQTREKCQCGAQRINHFAESGWKKGDEQSWFL